MRFYECDGYGHLNNLNYLRYMQETAFDASAAVGYDFARYDALGCYWLIRETKIEYLRPLRYGDTVEVKTWVEDFRRVRSRRAYEFRHVPSGKLVARADTDWVLVDSVKSQPMMIPHQMMLVFFPHGVPPAAPRRERFPDAPPPPPGVFTITRRVSWQDLDPAQHVNNAVYLAYVEDCGVQLAALRGWPISRIQAEGFALIARQHQIEYRQPALLHDELAIATWFSHLKRATAIRHYTIRRVRDGALLARVNTLYVWVNSTTGQPIRVPAHFIQDFADNRVE